MTKLLPRTGLKAADVLLRIGGAARFEKFLSIVSPWTIPRLRSDGPAVVHAGLDLNFSGAEVRHALRIPGLRRTMPCETLRSRCCWQLRSDGGFHQPASCRKARSQSHRSKLLKR